MTTAENNLIKGLENEIEELEKTNDELIMEKIENEIIHDNGTPYTDEQWKKWYGHTSNKERQEMEDEMTPSLEEVAEEIL